MRISSDSVSRQHYDYLSEQEKKLRKEKLTVSSGRLLEETSRQQGKRFVAVSKQGDTLELSKEGMQLSNSMDMEQLKENVINHIEKENKYSNVDYLITDEMQPESESDIDFWYNQLKVSQNSLNYFDQDIE